MAQAGYTPIQLYYSTTGGVTPTAGNLANGELAINITDGKLFYKDNLGAVQTIANKNSTGTVTSVALSGGTTGLTVTGSPITTSGTITLAGTLAVANGGTGQTTYTDGQLLIGNSTGNTLTKATLTAGTGVTITNGAGSITIASSGGTSPVKDNPLTVVTSKQLAIPGSSAYADQYASKRIVLDANRELLVLGTSSGYDAYAVVYNSSTDTFGTPVLIRSACSLMGAVLYSTDKVLVVSVDYSTRVAMEAVVLSVSTNTITVNTAATTTLSSTASYLGGFESFVTVGSTSVLSYGTSAPGSYIRGFTVSGTTVTIGSATLVSSSFSYGFALYLISSSVVLAFGQTASTTLSAIPYSVSGTTLTAGTAATQTFGVTDPIPAGVLQSGQIAFLYNNTNFYGGIISVSSTTASISTAKLADGTYSNYKNVTFAVSGDKVLVFASLSVDNAANVLTNSSGTASAGTKVTLYGAPSASFAVGATIFCCDYGPVISISGSNAVINVSATYKVPVVEYSTNNSANTTKYWNGNALVPAFSAFGATLTYPNTTLWQNYLKSDGTVVPTRPINIGFVVTVDSGVCWYFDTFSSTTSRLTKVTIA